MAKRGGSYYREVWGVQITHGPVFPHFHSAPWPPVDMMETEEGIIIRVEIAGMRKEEIEVTLEGDMLVIRGRRDMDTPQGARFHQMEISQGKFERKIPLPGEVDTEGTRARYKEGFLIVELPYLKGEGGGVKKVEVI